MSDYYVCYLFNRKYKQKDMRTLIFTINRYFLNKIILNQDTNFFLRTRSILHCLINLASDIFRPLIIGQVNLTKDTQLYAEIQILFYFSKNVYSASTL